MPEREPRPITPSSGVSPTQTHVSSAELAHGKPLDAAVRSRMETGFGRSFADVNVHTDERAGQLAAAHSARAFALGHEVVFGQGQYRPNDAAGELLIAHELAHVLQQHESSGQGWAGEQAESQPLEQDANLAAGNALLRSHASSHERAGLPAARVQQRSGLRLARCDVAHAPSHLQSFDAKVEWVRQTAKGSQLGKAHAIGDVLAGLTAHEFIELQSRISFSSLLSDLDDEWESVRIGTLGPVRDGRDRLNRIRADYLFGMTRERGVAQAQVVAHWMFNNMYGDDIHDVLTLLAEDQHLHNTVDVMPSVLELLSKRDVDRSKFRDRAWVGGDVARGLKNFISSNLESPVSKESKGGAYLRRDLDLPAEYQQAVSDVFMAQFQEAMQPGNLVLGSLDYLAFNIPSSAKGLVTGTVGGIKDLTEGHVESGVEALTGSVIFVLGIALGVRAFRKSARMAALLELTPEGQASVARLRATIGQAGIDRVARYVQADSKAAFFVRELGVPAIEALCVTKGDLAAARALLLERQRLIGLVGQPSGVLTGTPGTPYERQWEVPYTVPEDLQVVRVGQPLRVKSLNPAKRYLWVIDEAGDFRIAVEGRGKSFPKRPTLKPPHPQAGQTPLKHGDLVPGPEGKTRGIARAGGDFRAELGQDGKPTGTWEMTPDSSYTFARTDFVQLSFEQLEAARELLGTTGTDISLIVPKPLE